MTRSSPWWVVPLTVVVALPAAVVGGLPGAAVVAALGLQALVAARHWSEVGRTSRTLVVRVLPALVGWIVVVALLDAGVGLLIDRARGVEVDPPVETSDLRNEELPPTTDPRVDAEAYEGVPWVERFFEEMDALRYDYVPFIGPRIEEVHGQYINSADGIRTSYEPAGSEADGALEVWFFGGSTTWGEGQRDLHTIPSEVARLAEEDDVALRVVNFGERGYTAYQEYLLFEQEAAERGAPDLAVFYDGQNELGTQQQTPENLSEQPTVYQLETVLESMARAPSLPGAGAPPEPSLGTEYVETSALHKLLRRLGLVEPAGAQEVSDLDEVVANPASIYRRSVELLRDLGERSGTPTVHFLQPGHRDDPLIQELVRRAPAGVIDITDAYLSVPDDDQLFIDGGHTNELGAHLSAVAIWEHLQPVVEGLQA